MTSLQKIKNEIKNEVKNEITKEEDKALFDFIRSSIKRGYNYILISNDNKGIDLSTASYILGDSNKQSRITYKHLEENRVQIDWLVDERVDITEETINRAIKNIDGLKLVDIVYKVSYSKLWLFKRERNLTFKMLKITDDGDEYHDI